MQITLLTMQRQLASLDSYRTSLHGVVPLTPENEHELAIAWRNGDSDAGRRLVEASLPFVIRIANEYRRWGVPLEDLIQQGNLGLLRAAQKFEPEKQCRLITYAVYWIRAEIRDYVVRGYRIVRLGTTRTERRALRMFRREEIGSPAELAELSGMPIARAEKLFPILKQSDMFLDASYDDQSSPMEFLSDDESASPEDLAAAHHDVENVRGAFADALATLSEREQRIVQARMIADEPETLDALGRKLGVSKERVRQIEERARQKLREALAEYAPVAA